MTTKTAGPRKPPVPAGMTRSRGGRFWVASVGEYVFTVAELQILEEVCRLLNEIDAIRKAMTGESLVVLGSRGQPRPSQWLAELRGHRKLLGGRCFSRKSVV